MLSSLCRRQFLQRSGWSTHSHHLRDLRVSRPYFASRRSTRTLTSWTSCSERWHVARSAFRTTKISSRLAAKTPTWTPRRAASTLGSQEAQPHKQEPEQEQEQGVESEGSYVDLTEEQMSELITRVTQEWGRPSRDPAGWSSDWSNWSYLMTYYWVSPYYLGIPQLDMIVKIKYGISGDTRPVLYSLESREFIFRLLEEPGKFFLLNGDDGGTLYLLQGIGSEEGVLELLESREGNISREALSRVEPSAEGEAILQRIFEEDESVIDVLEEQLGDLRPFHIDKAELWDGILTEEEGGEGQEGQEGEEELPFDLENVTDPKQRELLENLKRMADIGSLEGESLEQGQVVEGEPSLEQLLAMRDELEKIMESLKSDSPEQLLEDIEEASGLKELDEELRSGMTEISEEEIDEAERLGEEAVVEDVDASEEQDAKKRMSALESQENAEKLLEEETERLNEENKQKYRP